MNAKAERMPPVVLQDCMVVRPGDTLFLRFGGVLTEPEVREIRDRTMPGLPVGARLLIFGDGFEAEVERT